MCGRQDHEKATYMIKIDSIAAPAVASALLELGAVKLNIKKPFTWASGWKSPIYCDNRVTLSSPDFRKKIKEYLTAVVRQNFPEADCIAAVATAGIPQGALVADALQLPFIYVRPKPKEHGMKNQIEGGVKKWRGVVMIEDLISTGGSSLGAAHALREAGLNVAGMAAIFTYGFPLAEENFRKENIDLVCLSDFMFLLDEVLKKGALSKAELVSVKSWRMAPDTWPR